MLKRQAETEGRLDEGDDIALADYMKSAARVYAAELTLLGKLNPEKMNEKQLERLERLLSRETDGAPKKPARRAAS